MAQLDAYFNFMMEMGASDLHLASGSPPIVRIRGELERLKMPTLENEALKSMLYEIAPELKQKRFEETGDVDFGYEIPGVARVRANCVNHETGSSAVFRLIPAKVLHAEQLGLPPILKKFAMLHKRLVLVTGPTGSGKSPTLAAIVDYANKERRDHIITVED